MNKADDMDKADDMTGETYTQQLGTGITYFDGGTGTMLQKEGLGVGQLPEEWNLTHKDKIIQLHKAYLAAGANIIKTNTFGANILKFPLNMEKVVTAAVQNAHQAVQEWFDTPSTTHQPMAQTAEQDGSLPSAKRKTQIALDIGPTGKLLKPMGDLDFEDAVRIFKKTIEAGLMAGVDVILIETMNDVYEARAAVIAAKEAIAAAIADSGTVSGVEAASKCSGQITAVQAETNRCPPPTASVLPRPVHIPIYVTTVYDENLLSLTGSTPEVVAAVLEGLGVDALGMNCSLGPRAMLPVVKRLRRATSLPIIVNPNAGLPRTAPDGSTVYDVDADEFALLMVEIVAAGASMVGGCCGTTPEYIRKTIEKTSLLLLSQTNGSSLTHGANSVTSVSVHNTPQLSQTNGSSITHGANSVTSGGVHNTPQLSLSNGSSLTKRANNVTSGGSETSVVNGGGTCETSCTQHSTLNTQHLIPSAVIASSTRVSYIGGALPVLIGERINPTGKKRFKEALRAGDMPYIVQQALEQEAAGAQVLDVNVGLPEIDEKEMMVRAISEIQSVCYLPLQIDTSSPAVMEAALRRYNGKALINSVNGKEEVMEAVFPLVKKYGGAVVCLTIDEGGIPKTAEGRVEIAQKICRTAAKWGIKKSDLVIDSLAMAVSADSGAAHETLRAVKMLHELGFHTILGVSNVSFGLPQREKATSAFFMMALTEGLSAAIMNPLASRMMEAYKCYALLAGQDENAAGYINWCETHPLSPSPSPSTGICGAISPPDDRSLLPTQNQTLNTAHSTPPAGGAAIPPLQEAIERGLRVQAAKLTEEQLEEGADSLDIIDHYIIAALDAVGKRFEAKTLYLPQLLMSAEAASASFDVIKRRMNKDHEGGGGKVIIATVKGDIHDIGKNIVKVLLENYGFDVIDLGKDVPPEVIVERAVKEHIMLVGLSALMTTTVPSMEETIKQLREKAPWAKVCVGGAVMTEEYASMIGADFYGKDAMATVRYARCVLGETQ